MIKVYYHWKKLYFYPSLYAFFPFVLFVLAVYYLFFEYNGPEIWGRMVILLVPITLCVRGFWMSYSIISSSRQIIKISYDDLYLSDASKSIEDIRINYSQIVCYKKYENGLGEIHTTVDNGRIIIISMAMINYQKLIDWLIQKGVKQKK